MAKFLSRTTKSPQNLVQNFVKIFYSFGKGISPAAVHELGKNLEGLPAALHELGKNYIAVRGNVTVYPEGVKQPSQGQRPWYTVAVIAAAPAGHNNQ